MRRVADAFHLWRRLVGARFRSQLQYRTSFALNVSMSFAATFTDFIVILVLFDHFPALDGWSLGEIALLYGISGIGVAVADMLVGHIDQLYLDIRSGKFDVVLLRPAGTLLQVISSDLALRRLGRVAQAALVLAYACAVADIPWNATRIALLAVGIASAAIVYAGVFILSACVTFWVVGGAEIGAAFTYGGNAMTSYPLNIYGPWLRRIFAFVVPLAFVTYFPGLYLLDKPDPLGFPTAFQFLAPIAAIAFAAVTGFAWRFAVRHYRSTGS